jgi:Outer membrane protein beta-barrel family/Carboxypeptidase regulatory-like domain
MKTIFSIALLLIMSLLSFVSVEAQTPPATGKITGQLADAAGKPLEFATLLLLQAKDSSLVKGEISDARGVYAFENIPAGAYRVAGQQVGYRKAYSQLVTIDSAHLTIALPVLTLAEETKQLAEVQVVAKKPFIEQQVDRTVLNVENSIVSSGSTALEVLEKAPGVTIDRQNDQIKLRGKSGVIVYIDGKPSYLSQAEVSNLLKSTPSDNIASIEIITQPGSKYDAAGNSGIINIKMKRNKNFGTNGSLTAGAGYGWVYDLDGKFVNRPKVNGSLNLNHREGKLSLFGTVSAFDRQSFGSNVINRVIPYQGKLTYFDQSSFRPNTRNGLSYRAGLDYFLTKKTTIGLLVNGFTNNELTDGLNRSVLSDQTGTVTSRPTTTANERGQLLNWTGNLNVKHEFNDKGRELTADVDAVRYDGRNSNLLNTKYLNGQNQPSRPDQSLRTAMPSLIDIWAVKTDYVHPLAKGAKVEAGLKSAFVDADNNSMFDTLQLEKQVWQRDAGRSNQFQYAENVNAAYANYTGSLGKKLKIQLGLRAEHTHSSGYSVTLDQRVTRDYLDFFPTVFLSQTLDSTNVLNLSYSRRIDRPDYQNLNPFVYYLDPFTYQQGNPFLRPQYTSNIELTHVYKGAISTAISFSRTTDFINQETPVQIPEKNVIYVTPQNLGTLDNIGLTVSFPVTVTKWWTMQNNINGYYQHYNTFYLAQPYEVKFVALNLYASNSFKINKVWSAEVSGWFNTGQQYGFYKAQPMGSFDMGIQRKVLDGKGSFKLNINDPFWLAQFQGRAQVQDIDFRVQSRWENRRVSLTFSYRFGNQNVKAARQRDSATSGEQGRVKQ